MELKIGNGYDVHALADGLPMWLGGVRIPSDRGFVVHSDGDVAIHALCDALLKAGFNEEQVSRIAYWNLHRYLSQFV